MRWKLLLIVSLLAAAAGTSAILTLAPLPYSNAEQPPGRPAIAGAVLIPLVSITVASIFVYRHTPRRRKLQATLTVVLACLLTLLAVVCAAFLS